MHNHFFKTNLSFLGFRGGSTWASSFSFNFFLFGLDGFHSFFGTFFLSLSDNIFFFFFSMTSTGSTGATRARFWCFCMMSFSLPSFFQLMSCLFRSFLWILSIFMSIFSCSHNCMSMFGQNFSVIDIRCFFLCKDRLSSLSESS